MAKKIQFFLETPIRVTLFIGVLSVLITAVLSYVLAGKVYAISLVIAGVCGTILPYWTSSITYRYQQDLAKKTEELEKLATELQASNEQLAASNADLNAYAHTVAHDLKNPLSVILGASGMLAARSDSLSDKDTMEFLDIIARTSQKMTNIIGELLLLSSLRHEEIHVEPLEMSTIFAEAQTRLQPIVDENQATIILPEVWPEAKGYQPWVEAVWTNYLSNALKYGGVPPQIEVGGTAVDDSFIRFWIKDNGKGISPEEQARLFVPFERLSQTMSSIEGHGLGLSIVQRIVDKLHGQVGIESNGSGTLFFFTLPAAQNQMTSSGNGRYRNNL